MCLVYPAGYAAQHPLPEGWLCSCYTFGAGNSSVPPVWDLCACPCLVGCAWEGRAAKNHSVSRSLLHLTPSVHGDQVTGLPKAVAWGPSTDQCVAEAPVPDPNPNVCRDLGPNSHKLLSELQQQGFSYKQMKNKAAGVAMIFSWPYAAGQD